MDHGVIGRAYSRALHSGKPSIADQTGARDGIEVVVGTGIAAPQDFLLSGEARCGIRSEDGAGGITIPLLLYAASILRPEVIDRKEALDILADRVKVVKEHRKVRNCRIQNWPGPLALYVLGETDIVALRERCGNDVHEKQIATNYWKTDFFEGLTELGRGNRERFEVLVAKMVDDVEQNTSNKKIFPSRLWNTELFIARHEVRRLRGEPDPLPDAGKPPSSEGKSVRSEKGVYPGRAGMDRFPTSVTRPPLSSAASVVNPVVSSLPCGEKILWTAAY